MQAIRRSIDGWLAYIVLLGGSATQMGMGGLVRTLSAVCTLPLSGIIKSLQGLSYIRCALEFESMCANATDKEIPGLASLFLQTEQVLKYWAVDAGS